MNNRRLKHTLSGLTLLLLSGIIGVSSAFAQLERTVQLTAPELDNYPQITFYLDPKDRDGSPLLGLTEDQITLHEDQLKRELTEFRELEPGIQLVVAFNISSAFALRDINANSRFDFIKESVLNWAAQAPSSSPDDLSIVTNSGLEAVHLTDRAEWAGILEEYSPDLRGSESNFNVLSRAIEIAADPVDQPGMKRVVLLFSAQPSSESYTALDSMLSQAQDNQVLIYNILISSPAFFDTEGANKLRDLSRETGGQFQTYSDEEPLFDLGQILNPLRSTYLVRYQSSIVASGTHTLEVSIASSPGEINGQREFTLEIEPPNPIFIYPPFSITRSPEENTKDQPDVVSFQPGSYSLAVLIEFPDGHPRELEELIFRVDDEVTARLTSPPFDEITWNLEEYLNSGTHYLTLEAVDIMGLSKVSLPTPVEIIIEQPPQSVGMIISRNLPAFLGLGFILLLGTTLFLLVTRGTIRPTERKELPWIITQGRRTASFITTVLHPNRIQDHSNQELTSHPYRLIPINDASQNIFPEPITVYQTEVTLGNQNGEGRIAIPHPSIIADHSRIKALEDGEFQISDLGAAGGTWINYQQITGPKPHIIRDGDIIHIGEAAFRFQIIPHIKAPLQNEENNP